MTFCQSGIYSQLNDTNLNNFHRKSSAVWTVGLVRASFTTFAAIAAKRCHLRIEMKEPHWGLFNGKVTNVATSSSIVMLWYIRKILHSQCNWYKGYAQKGRRWQTIGSVRRMRSIEEEFGVCWLDLVVNGKRVRKDLWKVEVLSWVTYALITVVCPVCT